jgi:hypothetical protein
MVRLSILVPRHWPGPLIRVIIIVVVYVLAVRWAPGDVLPLSVGALLGGWLGVSVGPEPVGPPKA